MPTAQILQHSAIVSINIMLTSVVAFCFGDSSYGYPSTSNCAFEDRRSRMRVYETIFFSLFDYT